MPLNKNVILYISPDADDQHLLQKAITELGLPNALVGIGDGDEAFAYLQRETPPFVILCDYRLHGTSGVELRRRIEGDEALREKSIPFVFFSTSVSREMTKEVYRMQVQGLFEKGYAFSETKRLLKMIYDYWQTCRHPNQ